MVDMCGGNAAICAEPLDPSKDASWQFVGAGKGGYAKVQTFSYVGKGLGSYEQEEVSNYYGRKIKPGCLILIAVVVVSAAIWMAFVTGPPEITSASTTPLLRLRPESPEEYCVNSRTLTSTQEEVCCAKFHTFCGNQASTGQLGASTLAVPPSGAMGPWMRSPLGVGRPMPTQSVPAVELRPTPAFAAGLTLAPEPAATMAATPAVAPPASMPTAAVPLALQAAAAPAAMPPAPPAVVTVAKPILVLPPVPPALPIQLKLPYDCAVDFVAWVARWSIAKKAWCCQAEGKGCPPAVGGCAGPAAPTQPPGSPTPKPCDSGGSPGGART